MGSVILRLPGAAVSYQIQLQTVASRAGWTGAHRAGGTLGQPLDPNTWEFKLATFQVNAAAFGPGLTHFNVVQPNIKAAVGPFTYATVKVDGATFTIRSDNTQGTYAGSSGATWPIPEPATVGILGAAAVGLLGRRRR